MTTFNAKPLQDAVALVEKGDFARASDKLWETVTLAVKAATGEWNAEGPREIRRLVDRLFQQTEDRDLLRLYSVADSLRANAGENFLSGESVRAYADDVRTLVEKLHALPQTVNVGQAPPPAISRKAEFENRISGLTRRETRQHVLAELARVDSQMDTFAPARSQSGIPGSAEARIANALQQQVNRREDPAGQELGRYQQWLLGVLTGGRPALHGRHYEEGGQHA